MSNLPVKYKESFFRKLVNKIKTGFLSNNNIVENNISKEYQYEEFRKSNKVDLEKIDKDKLYEKGSIEYALDQFCNSLVHQYKNYGIVLPYSALIELGGNTSLDSNGNNIEQENRLINNLKGNIKYNIKEQKDKNGNVLFYHIANKNYSNKLEDKNADPVRIYLNTKRKNVATLASVLTKSFENDNMYFKFSSDYQLGKKSRSEAIVIYTDTIKMPNILNKLDIIHNQNIQLFEGAENKNPFMKSIGGYLTYAPDPQTDEYIKSNGEIEKIAKSYNNFLSKALQESFIKASQETVSRSEELTRQTEGNISEDINFYVKYFESFKEGNYGKFISLMKEKLKLEAERNRVLDIKGISDKEKGGKYNYGK